MLYMSSVWTVDSVNISCAYCDFYFCDWIPILYIKSLSTHLYLFGNYTQLHFSVTQDSNLVRISLGKQ